MVHKKQKTKDRATRTALKTGSELKDTGRVSSCWSTSIIRHGTHVSLIWRQDEIELGETGHICGKLWHSQSVAIIIVIMTAKVWKWWSYNLFTVGWWFINDDGCIFGSSWPVIYQWRMWNTSELKTETYFWPNCDMI
jgi:hypothetical protein